LNDDPRRVALLESLGAQAIVGKATVEVLVDAVLVHSAKADPRRANAWLGDQPDDAVWQPLNAAESAQAHWRPFQLAGRS